MLDDDGAAVAALVADERDAAVAGRLDRRAGRRGVIGAEVRAHAVEHGMEAAATEIRADAEHVERRAQEGLAQRLAAGGVIACVALRVGVAHGAQRVALVHELGGEDVAGAQLLAVLVQVLVDHRVAVADADVLHEVDVVAEDVGQLDDELVRQPGGDAGLVQRISDAAHRVGRAVLDLGRQRNALEAGIGAADLQRARLVERQRQFLQSLRPLAQVQHVTGAQSLEALAVAAEAREFHPIGNRQALRVEDARQRVSRLHGDADPRARRRRREHFGHLDRVDGFGRDRRRHRRRHAVDQRLAAHQRAHGDHHECRNQERATRRGKGGGFRWAIIEAHHAHHAKNNRPTAALRRGSRRPGLLLVFAALMPRKRP